TKMTIRVRVPGAGTGWPHAASKEMIGTGRPLQLMVPRYHGGTPSTFSGACHVTTSATHALGTIKRSCASGISRLYNSCVGTSALTTLSFTRPFFYGPAPTARSRRAADFPDTAYRDNRSRRSRWRGLDVSLRRAT